MKSQSFEKLIKEENEFKKFLYELLSENVSDLPLKSRDQQLEILKNGINISYERFVQEMQEAFLLFIENIHIEESAQLDSIMQKLSLHQSKHIHKNLKKKVSLTSEDYRFLAEIAKRRFRDRHLNDASSMFRLIILLNPLYTPAWIGIALCLQERGELEELDKLYQMAFPLCIASPIFCLCAAKHFVARGKTYEAKEICQAALQQAHRENNEYKELKSIMDTL